MSDSKPVGPVNPGGHLLKATENEEALKQQQYQSLVGSLMFVRDKILPMLSTTLQDSPASPTEAIGLQPNES